MRGEDVADDLYGNGLELFVAFAEAVEEEGEILVGKVLI